MTQACLSLPALLHCLSAYLAPTCFACHLPACPACVPCLQMSWMECQDGGDPNVAVSPRDIVYVLGGCCLPACLPSCLPAFLPGAVPGSQPSHCMSSASHTTQPNSHTSLTAAPPHFVQRLRLPPATPPLAQLPAPTPAAAESAGGRGSLRCCMRLSGRTGSQSPG